MPFAPVLVAAAGPSAALLAQAADALACPLLLLGAQGRLLHANRAGHAWLADGRWLHLDAQGQVRARPPEAAAALAAALERAAHGPPALLQAPPGTPDGCATLSRVSPAGSARAVLLMLGATGADRLPDLAGYAELHGLSAAETRVLGALARGATPAESARTLGVAVSTVRSQVAALRRKTGHRSLGALLRELASLPPLHPAGGE